jgi:hypothetical protein
MTIYSLYWFSGGPDFGARYWYLMLIPLVALTVRGIHYLEQTLGPESGKSPRRGALVLVGILSLCIFALVNYFPWRAIDKYHHYRGMRPDIRYLAKKYNFGKSLVLIRGDLESDYMSAWTYNPLHPDADAPIYAWDRNREVGERVLEAYQNRPVWIVNGPSISESSFDVIDGPLSALELLAKKTPNNKSP